MGTRPKSGGTFLLLRDSRDFCLLIAPVLPSKGAETTRHSPQRPEIVFLQGSHWWSSPQLARDNLPQNFR